MDESKNTIENMLKMGMGADPNYDKVMENFKVSCPVKIINIDLETPEAVVGMYLLTWEEAINYIKEKAEIAELKDNSLLFFTNQHIVELSTVLNGMLYLLKMQNLIADENITKAIKRFINICKDPLYYTEYKQSLREWKTNTIFTDPKKSSEICNKIIDIMELLPFISYNTLDEIAKMGIDEFQKGLNNDK